MDLQCSGVTPVCCASVCLTHRRSEYGDLGTTPPPPRSLAEAALGTKLPPEPALVHVKQFFSLHLPRVPAGFSRSVLGNQPCRGSVENMSLGTKSPLALLYFPFSLADV